MKENAFLRWMSANTQSIYWHDSAILTELEMGISNGARGMTTNPFLIGQTLTKTPESWPEIIAACRETEARACIVEQDNCYGKDPFDCLKLSFDNMVKFGL